MIEISGVTKRHAGCPEPVLDAVDLTIPAGEVFGLLGPNGAGKSTLLLLLMGLVRKDAGSVRVGGVDLDRDPNRVRAHFGLVPQAPAFYPTLTARENLRLFAWLRGISRRACRREIERVARIVDISSWLDRRAGKLSGGLQGRLNLALGLLGNPLILSLDEPTAGIDPQSRKFVLEAVRELCVSGATVLFTSHYLEEVASLCSRAAILDQGRVLASDTVEGLERLGPAVLKVSFATPPGDERLVELVQTLGGRMADVATVELPFDAPGRALVALGETLQHLGLTPCSIRYGERDLEELFFHLTGRNPQG